MTATPVECTCPDGGGYWQCIDGVIYGPCTSDQCPGSCVRENDCDCTATTHTPGMHGTPWPPWDSPPTTEQETR